MFLDDNFLLKNEWAQKLYHNYAKSQPIIDYHCHLDAKEIYEDKKFANLTKIWLNDSGIGDHYKWRLMRANGVAENLITGDGDDYEKFLAFVMTIEQAIGNPVYEWSHLELKRYFGIELVINKKNAPDIWQRANDLLQQPEYSAKNLIKKMKVELIATTDDPASELQYHQLLNQENNSFKVVPTFRPDKLMEVTQSTYREYLSSLENLTKHSIRTLEDLESVIEQRISFFHSVGCRLADHGLNTFDFINTGKIEASEIFANAMSKANELTVEDGQKFQSYLQMYLMGLYKQHDWTMQLHLNVFRNASDLNLDRIGRDSGFDSIGDQSGVSKNILNLYKEAEKADAIPKSIWYSLNPNDSMTLATLMASFQGSTKQRIQLGAAWWMNDNYDGMREQLIVFAQQSLLGNFVGMLTDSRSFLSYPRHEYFRRVLCGLIGEWVVDGRLPEDNDYLGSLVAKICYHNAYEYFGFFE